RPSSSTNGRTGTPSLSWSSAILILPQLKRPRLLRSAQVLAHRSSRGSRRPQARFRGLPSCAIHQEAQVLRQPFPELRIRIDLYELEGASSFHLPLLNLLVFPKFLF